MCLFILWLGLFLFVFLSGWVMNFLFIFFLFGYLSYVFDWTRGSKATRMTIVYGEYFLSLMQE